MAEPSGIFYPGFLVALEVFVTSTIFLNVFFAGTDGKCVIRNFTIDACAMLQKFYVMVPGQ